MEFIKALKNVKTLNEYIAITQDVSNIYKNEKIQFNMSTVLALKKVRSLEIEYFNKSEDNGAACLIFERMLAIPPSKTWDVLGKEMAALLQYWLDALRKHLISHNLHWWTFLKLVLRFLKTLRTKGPGMPNTIVEHTAESLLDLASHEGPTSTQRREILVCLNMFSAEAGREIRMALRKRFSAYFTKLSVHLASAPVPCQVWILETLLRWLLPRHDQAVRRQAAANWFPAHLYSDTTVNLFLTKQWMDFFKDARDFLNVHNSSKELVTSVVCRKLVIGNTTIVSDSVPREVWLDINSMERCLSVLLDPKLLEAVGVTTDCSCEALIINNEDTLAVQMFRDSGVKITVKTSHPPRLTSSITIPGCDVSCDVTATISSRSDLARVDRALRCVFAERYQLLLDLNNEPSLSPENSTTYECELDTRFSHPVEIRRRKHSGYIVRSKNPVGWNSPSTASTTSLAQLHDKLESLPHFRYEREPVSVCARPALSSVTEVSETDDKQSLNTTIKYTSYGVCYTNIRSYENKSKKSQSDGEVACKGRKTVSGKQLSPVVKDNTPSCLLVATIGSAEESVINDTLERISKTKEYSTDNIVDLLVQEALGQKQAEEKEKLLDSGINTGDIKRSQDNENNLEEIENTPGAEKVIKKGIQVQQDINISPSNESNSEVINETPFDYVSVRKKNSKVCNRNEDPIEKTSFDIEAVEEFFSQHFTENKAGNIVISPTLAKKINKTSSETSEDLEYQYLIMNENGTNINELQINEIDIIECLNSMVDSVCNDFDKCTEYLNKDNNKTILGDIRTDQGMPLQVVTNTYEETHSKVDPNTNSKSIKLKYRTARKFPNRNVRSGKNKKTTKTTPKMSTIIEDINDNAIAELTTYDKEIFEETTNLVVQASIQITDTAAQTKNRPTPNTLETPKNIRVNNTTSLLKRKRKLYSPKDEHANIERNALRISETEDDDLALSEIKSSISKNKSTATCYKDIERERKRIRQTRKRKSNSYVETPSPRETTKNAIFDRLKETVESNEKIIVVDKTAFDISVYNFSSDSEDDDFKKKKINLRNRNSTTTVGSFESAMSTRNRKGKKNVKYTENTSSNDDGNKKKVVRRKKVNKRQRSKTHVEPEVIVDLVDERMRQQPPEDLNTSFVFKKDKEVLGEPVLCLDKSPELEIIADDIVYVPKKKPNRKNKNTHTKAQATKSAVLEIITTNDNDRTVSPLPGLVVESVPAKKDDSSSILGNMLSKFKKIYEEGPDTVNETNTTHNLLSDMERNNLSVTNNYNNDVMDHSEVINVDNYNTNDYEQNRNNRNKTNKKKTKTAVQQRNFKTENLNKSKANEKSMSIVDRTNADDIKSIPSEGITGHGILDEAPPDPQSIKEVFRARSLELVDLNQSMRDYFVELTNEINGNEDSGNSPGVKRVSVDNSTERSKDNERSPVVSIARLTFDDISKWLPSRRSSETDSSFVEENFNAKSPISAKSDIQQTRPQKESRQKNKRDNIGDFDEMRSNKTKDNVSYNRYSNRKTRGSDSDDSGNNLSEIIVSVSKVNTRKFSRNTKTKTSYHSDSHDSDNAISMNVEKSYSKPKRSFNIDADKNNTEIESDIKPNTRSANHSYRTRANSSDSDNSDKNVKEQYEVRTNIDSEKANRKSMISPIKLFDDFQLNKRDDKKSQSSDDEYIKNIRSMFSKEKSQARSSRQRERSVIEDDGTSLNSRMSTSTKIDTVNVAVKRKSSPILVASKKRKSEVNNNVTVTPESGPSACSVTEWFTRNEPARKAERFDAPFTDSIQTVMEKLDTTLVEIHQNTSKRLVRMFVEAQKQLTQLKTDRRATYKLVAKDIFAALVQIMDEKFADLDRRSQQMDTEFMVTLKKQATEVVKEDCKQKRAMVLLLKEDLQAVLEHTKRNQRTESP